MKNRDKIRESRFKSRDRQGDRAVTKDPAGRRVRTKNQSSAGRAVIPYQQPKAAKARYKNRDSDKVGQPIGSSYRSQPRDNQRAYTGPGGRVNVRSATGRVSNVFPQFRRDGVRSKPRTTQHPTSNRKQLARLRKLQRNPADAGGNSKKVQVRSASKAYIARKSINPMARFSRGRRKQGDQAKTKDLAGRPLLKKNYETPRPGVIPQGNPYRGRKRIGDKPAQASRRGPQSATRTTERAWKGDVAGRKVRGRNFRSNVNTGGSRIPGEGNAPKPRFGDGRYHGNVRKGRTGSATEPGEKRTGTAPIPVRAPGRGAQGIGNYRGKLRLFEARPSMGPQGADYTGNIKAHKPLKGGGSVSGKRWNNNGTPIPVRPPSGDTQRAGRFQGNIKGHRPDKGGGSVSGKLWNNNQTPIPVNPPSSETQRAGRFQGNIKAHKPQKGGGSVSGKLWNNNETPIPVRPPSNETQRASSYPGGQLLFEANPSMVDQGEEFTGAIRLKRFKRNYLKNPNQADEAILKARPNKNTYRVNDLHVKVRQYNYIHNPSSAKEALNVREPGKAFGKATDYQGNIKMKKFELFEKHNRNLHPDAQFVKTNKNNVSDERSFLTNVKLWWAKHFRKSENLPPNVKEKERKPRYDKGEQGLWYE